MRCTACCVIAPITFSANEDFAHQLDAADPLEHVGDVLLAHQIVKFSQKAFTFVGRKGRNSAARARKLQPSHNTKTMLGKMFSRFTLPLLLLATSIPGSPSHSRKKTIRAQTAVFCKKCSPSKGMPR